MKCIVITVISILVICCNETTSRLKQVKQIEEDWKLEAHIFSSNSYTARGLLDTTFTKTYSYFNGVLIDSFNSIIIRRYQNDKLTSEKDYDLDENGRKEMSNEKINQYDKRGNLVSSIMQTDHFMNKTFNVYNILGMVVKRIVINKIPKRNPNDEILDSAMAHRNDKKEFDIDTTVSLLNYDKQGNLIKTTITDMKGRIVGTAFYQHLDKEEISSYSINSSGDTTLRSISKHDGNLIKKVNTMSGKMDNVDTIWIDGKNVVKSISHSNSMNFKNKVINKYNSKGDRIESISYR
jgi:hypothetical protein